MKTARVFRNGKSQVVRIPKEFQIEAKEVEIERKGDALVLRPKKKSWDALIRSLDKFTGDFMKNGRNQPRVQKRGKAS